LIKKTIVMLCALAAFSGLVSANIVYNTNGSALSCGAVIGCIQNTPVSISDGGITVTYNPGSGSIASISSVINLGNLVSTGTGTNVDLTGLLLSINVNDTSLGLSGALPNGVVSGTISTGSSSALIQFSPNNTTTGFGTLPGVVLTLGAVSDTYQVLNPFLGLIDPSDGSPLGQTTIQGDVVQFVAPEPATFGLLGAALVGLGFLARKRKS
jgi:hypothetical protein